MDIRGPLGLVPLAVGFGVVAAVSLVILGWALYRKRRGEQKQQRRVADVAGNPCPVR